MEGTIGILWKLKQVYNLVRNNFLLLIISFLPLIIHLLSYFCHFANFNVFQWKWKELYFTILGVYLSWLLSVRLIEIFQKPKIEWRLKTNPLEHKDYCEQIVLEIKNSQDQINKIFGQTVLRKLTAKFTIGDKVSFNPRWTNNPEPLTDAQLDITKVPRNRFTYIIPEHKDQLLIALRDKKGKWFIVDEFRYILDDKEDEISWPNRVSVQLFNDGDKYEIEFDLMADSYGTSKLPENAKAKK